VNLAIADRAEAVAALPVDGVGLLRAEFMITDASGRAPPSAARPRRRREEFLDRMAASLLRITRAFAPGRSSTAPSTSAPTSSAA
jgi:pyruvate, water dikinase